MAKLTTEKFIAKAKAVHGDRYDYSKVKYVDSKTKVCIICKEHGEFWQQASNHLRGIRCPQCGTEARIAKRTLPAEEFFISVKAVHGDKYDYSRVKYVNKKTKVCIVCPVHGEFWQSPQDHLSGHGCEKCFRESLTKRYSLGKERFIEKANIVHDGLYDYSEVEYINYSIKESEGIIHRLKPHYTFLKNNHRILFWNIHGNVELERTIMLGLYDYSKYVIEIDKIMKAIEKNNPDVDKSSWPFVMLHTDVHILGFGLGYEETDLWYFLTCRKRLIRKNKMQRNRIVYYAIMDSSYDMGKVKLLEALDVDVENVDFDWSEKAYEKAYDDIYDRIRNHV